MAIDLEALVPAFKNQQVLMRVCEAHLLDTLVRAVYLEILFIECLF